MIGSLFSRRTATAPWIAITTQSAAARLVQVMVAGSERRKVVTYQQVSAASSREESLVRLRKEARSSPFRCSHLLQIGQYQIQLAEAPAVPQQELRQAVRWKLKDLLDYPVEQATVDVVNVPGDRHTSSRGQYVLAVSASNDVVAEEMRVYRQANVPLHAIDIPEMAQRNVAALFEEPERALALLAFTDRGGLLTFTSGGDLYLSRHTDITPTQLNSSASDVREQAFDRLVLELQRSIDHFDRQFSYVSLSRLLVASHGVPNLVQDLAGSV